MSTDNSVIHVVVSLTETGAYNPELPVYVLGRLRHYMEQRDIRRRRKSRDCMIYLSVEHPVAVLYDSGPCVVGARYVGGRCAVGAR